jgi:hypothetical protein
MPPEEMINFYLPQFSGIIEAYWGRNVIKLHSEYMGVIVLMLAGLAFRARARRREVIFWGVAALVATLVALGGHTPFYRLWYLLPMMKVVRAPAMIFYIAQLAIAVFVAIGGERLLREGVSRSYLIGWGIFGVVMLILAGGGALTSIAESLAAPEYYPQVQQNEGAVIGGAARSFLVLALGAGLMWAIAAGRMAPRTGVIALASVMALDLWSVERLYFRFSPRASELYAADPAIQYLQQLDQPGRTIALGMQRGRPADPFLDGDALVIHGVRSVTGHVGTEFQRWVELAGAKSPTPPPAIFQREFRRLTNTRFWLTDVDLPPELPQLPGMRFIKRVGPVQNAVGNSVFLYELDEQNPAAWVTPVLTEAPPEAIRTTIMNPAFEPRRAALFDSSSAIDGAVISAAPDPLPIEASVRYPSTRSISVQLSAPAPRGSALIVSENWYPGWNALVDGQPAEVARADYTFIGIPLREGARQIELSFADPSYARGRIITLVGLTLTLLLIAGGAVMERRRRV